MVYRRELITICRQIGTMMEVGVDFLRITRALREQTDDPRLLEMFNQIEHDMRMGGNLADAIEKAPDVFSPFAVSLIRQGEARGDIEGAWHRLADFLKQEAQEDKDLGLEPEEEIRYSLQKRAAAPSQTPGSTANPEASPEASPDELPGRADRWEAVAVSLLCWGCAFLLVLTVVWCGATAGWIESRWMVAMQLGAACLVAAGAAWSVNRQLNHHRHSQVLSTPREPGFLASQSEKNLTIEVARPAPTPDLSVGEIHRAGPTSDADSDDGRVAIDSRDEEMPF